MHNSPQKFKYIELEQHNATNRSARIDALELLINSINASNFLLHPTFYLPTLMCNINLGD